MTDSENSLDLSRRIGRLDEFISVADFTKSIDVPESWLPMDPRESDLPLGLELKFLKLRCRFMSLLRRRSTSSSTIDSPSMSISPKLRLFALFRADLKELILELRLPLLDLDLDRRALDGILSGSWALITIPKLRRLGTNKGGWLLPPLLLLKLLLLMPLLMLPLPLECEDGTRILLLLLNSGVLAPPWWVMVLEFRQPLEISGRSFTLLYV